VFPAKAAILHNSFQQHSITTSIVRVSTTTRRQDSQLKPLNLVCSSQGTVPFQATLPYRQRNLFEAC